MLCGEEHDVLWKKSLWRNTLCQGMKFCRKGKETHVCYGIVLLRGQNVERVVTKNFLTFHKKVKAIR